MIHSCSGGVVREKKKFDFAKVEILSTGQTFWFITNIPLLQVGDLVFVPSKNKLKGEKGRVLRIDKNVSQQISPIPIGRAKEILSICEEE